MDTQKLSLVLNGVLLLAIIVLVAFGYKEGNFGGVDKQTLQKEYIALDIYNKRDDEAKKLQQEIFQKDSELYKLQESVKELEALKGVSANDDEALQCIFDDLNQQERDKYILKSKCTTAKTTIEDEKQETVQKEPKNPKTVKTQSLTCKTHLKGSHHIPNECKEKLLTFIEQNSDAKSFNVVGIVDKNDFDLIEGLKNSSDEVKNSLNVSEFQVKQFELIAPLGLARARAKEAMQLIKSKLGKETDVVQASYELILEDERGFVIQAYK